MRSFTKNELIGVTLIFLVVFLVTATGLRQAIRRSRDAQRKADLGVITNALNKYHQDFGFFPPSEDGKIVACEGENFSKVKELLEEIKKFDSEIYISGLVGCESGKDSLRNLLDESNAYYLSPIPGDSKKNEGFRYLYLSNKRRFQLYAYLEGGQKEGGFTPSIVARQLYCGIELCNFGKSSADTPLDISIEEFEEELEKAKQTGR